MPNGQNLHTETRQGKGISMYRINNETYARMLTTTRMTRGMKMSAAKTMPARLTLRPMRSENECSRSTSSV